MKTETEIKIGKILAYVWAIEFAKPVIVEEKTVVA